MRYVGLGRDSLRSHFVFRPRHAPEWLHARFLPVVFLANKEELTGKTFTTSLNTTNPNTYVKFIFLRTSPLIKGSFFTKGLFCNESPTNENERFVNASHRPRLLLLCWLSIIRGNYKRGEQRAHQNGEGRKTRGGEKTFLRPFLKRKEVRVGFESPNSFERPGTSCSARVRIVVVVVVVFIYFE